MDTMFHEKETIGKIETVRVNLEHPKDPRTGMPDTTKPVEHNARRGSYTVEGEVIARHDPETGVLCIDCKHNIRDDHYTLTGDQVPEAQRILETQPVREQMLRRIIQVADAWYEQLRSVRPQARTDEEIAAESVESRRKFDEETNKRIEERRLRRDNS